MALDAFSQIIEKNKERLKGFSIGDTFKSADGRSSVTINDIDDQTGIAVIGEPIKFPPSITVEISRPNPYAIEGIIHRTQSAIDKILESGPGVMRSGISDEPFLKEVKVIAGEDFIELIKEFEIVAR